VNIAQIATSELTPYCIPIQFLEGPIEINGWIHCATKTMFFSMQEIDVKFHIDFRMIQSSEWLALLYIPSELISPA
jgi:hypothetical protein